MRQKSTDWQIYVHVILFLFACAFLIGLFLKEAALVSIFSKAMIAFLLLNIPLGIISLVSVAKGRVKQNRVVSLSVFSIVSILVGVAAWIFLVLLMKKP